MHVLRLIVQMGKRYSYLVYSPEKVLICVTLSEKAAQHVKGAKYYVKQLEKAPVVLPFDGPVVSKTSIPFEFTGEWKPMTWTNEPIEFIDTIHALLNEEARKYLGVKNILITNDYIAVQTLVGSKKFGEWLKDKAPDIAAEVTITNGLPATKKGRRRQPRGRVYKETHADAKGTT